MWMNVKLSNFFWLVFKFDFLYYVHSMNPLKPSSSGHLSSK
jgi:hypothetical protein